jgi:hypothetical protein
MSNTQRKGVALALSLIIAAAGTLPAFAGARSATQARNGYATARAQLRYPGVRHAKAGHRAAPSNKAPDDFCDLPSAGCESFLAN